MVKDLTQGKPAKVLWLFCLPILISAVFQQFYNMADSIIAGKVLGEEALAAVGASYPLTTIFIAVAFGFNLGCSAVVSKLFGEKNFRDLRSGVSTVMIASAVIGVVLTAAGVGAGRAVMQLLDTPADIMDDAMMYLYIYIGGFLFVLVYNVCTGVFSALGDSRTPLYFLVASSVANVGLDLIFTMVVPMGVAGLAWATFICQGLAGLICMATMFARVRKLPCEEKVPVFSFRLLGDMFYVAIPSVIQQCVVSVGNLPDHVPQKGRLSATGRAEDGNKLDIRKRQAYALERTIGRLLSDIVLDEILNPNHPQDSSASHKGQFPCDRTFSSDAALPCK